jgi:hypothetical protein
VKVNGVPVSSGKTELTEGPIGRQSEGAEIHFRNIVLKKQVLELDDSNDSIPRLDFRQ